MTAKITDSMESMVFQTTTDAKRTRINKTDYVVLEGACENDNVSVDFDVKVKYNYLRKHPVDLIKNDHIILQNQRGLLFFLFEAGKDQFTEGEEGSKVFEESGTTGDYRYFVRFVSKKPKPQSDQAGSKAGWTGDVHTDVSAILEKYGISEKAEGYSAVTEYMKKWSLEHPEKEWDIHGDQ